VLAFFHTIAARIRGFLRPGDLESDFDQEMAAHLEMAEEDGRRRGLTVEEARRAARVQLGGITQLRESRRAASGLPWGTRWLDGFALDAKLGLRMLRRSWGLTLAAGLAMTIVITIAAVVFVFLDEFMGRVTVRVRSCGHRPNRAARRDPPHGGRRDARGLRVPGEPPLLDPAPIGSLRLAEARARRRRVRPALTIGLLSAAGPARRAVRVNPTEALRDG
jgi:hypothetical protein